ncbi:hypothetical protein MNBD_GAMMA20-2174 [hydrothermal vent metagenome]|uniref:Uncharacterized protein n=1 Tax=hydrothermal vent metagenome TaxID=652676 RepID=A0A3B0ZYZ3_9ZZZZ
MIYWPQRHRVHGEKPAIATHFFPIGMGHARDGFVSVGWALPSSTQGKIADGQCLPHRIIFYSEKFRALCVSVAKSLSIGFDQ